MLFSSVIFDSILRNWEIWIYTMFGFIYGVETKFCVYVRYVFLSGKQ